MTMSLPMIYKEEMTAYVDSLPNDVSELQEIFEKLEEEREIKIEALDKIPFQTRGGSPELRAEVILGIKIDMIKKKIIFEEKIEKEKAELGHRGFSA